MSGYLWKYYLEDDLENFRHLLEGKLRPAPPPRRSGGSYNFATSLESPSSLGTSPTIMTRQKGDPGARYRGRVTLTRADINSKDANGLTILHHVATSTSGNSFEFAKALLEHPQVDLYAQDFESAWTSLHRAFYFGNISIARAIIDRDVKDALGHGVGGVVAHAGGLVKIKDREGNGPLDLFATTIKDRTLRPQLHEWTGSGEEGDIEDAWMHEDSGDDDRPSRRRLAPSVDIAGDELFMFGSNRNVTLGFGDEDDRQYPERPVLRRPNHLLKRFHREYLERRYLEDPEQRQLPGSHDLMLSDLPAFIRSTPLVVQDVQLSKLHTAVLTTDPEANLYICGHGPGGRLGTGSETTQFQFVCIEGGGLAHKRVLAVALGHNHTLALSDEGEIFSWGNNAYGQLGYSLPKTAIKDEEPVQTLPRQIFGPLKKEVVLGIAASRLHSMAYTSSALYAFGKNEGQLGIVDSDARSLEFQTTPRRVAASLFTSPIRSVSAIDRATICLLENHEVWTFANYGYAKLSFPLDGFSNHFLKSSFFTTKYDSKPNQICKITSGGDSICALSTAGEVYTVTVNKRSETTQDKETSTTNPSKIRGALSQPYRIWSLKKNSMAARDVGIDQDGSIILTTDAGTVWRRVKRTKIKDATASGIGDNKPKDYKFQRVPGLTRVVAVRASAFGAYAAVRKDCDVTRKQILVGEQALWDNMQPLLPFSDWLEHDPVKDDNFTQSGLEKSSDFHQLVKRVLGSDDFDQDLKDVTRFLEDDSEYDLVVVSTLAEIRIPVHQFMVASRSRILRQALSALRRSGPHSLSDPQFGDLVSFSTEESGRVVMTLHGVDTLTLFNFVLYVYTDNLVDFWHYTRQHPKMAYRYRQIRTELMRLAAKLELKQLEPAVRQMITPRRSLTQDMQYAIQDAAFFEDADVIVQLADGEVPVHSQLMIQRCPFFEGLFKGRAAGRWIEGRRTDPLQAIRVDLEHIEEQTFDLVLLYLYADAGDEIFHDFVSDNLGEALALDEYLDHIMDVLSVANELMLDRLSQVCQQEIGRHVTVRNVCQLLNAVSPCAVTEFKDAALEYTCLSLESVLQAGIDELDDDLLVELDEVVRENQLACMPFARSGRAELLLLEKYPELAEQIDRRRRAKVDSIMIQNKYAEDIGRGQMTFRPGSLDELSSSPLQQKARRRSGKEPKIVPESPSLGPSIEGNNAAAELLFDMDDEVDMAGEPSGRLSFKSPPANMPKSVPESRIIPTPGFDPRSTAAAISSVQSASSWLADDTFSQVATPTTRKPDKPWGTASLATKKLDLKAIMSAEGSSKPSNLSIALSAQHNKDERGVGASFAKMSQKERKKQQQQQQQATATHLANMAEEPKSTSPWQMKSPVTATGTQNLSNEFPTQSSTAQPKTSQPSTPQLTMRQTIANNGSAAKSKATPTQGPIPTQSTSHRSQPSPHASKDNTKLMSAPAPNDGKGFAIAQNILESQPPQSIRHIQQAQHSEASLQLSMQEILSQQAAEKAMIKDAAAKRSLQEIQQEQEFQEWWDKESRRAMELEAATKKAEERDQGRKKASKGRKNGGRGGGGANAAGTGKSPATVGVASSVTGAGRSKKKTERGDSTTNGCRQQQKERTKLQPDVESETKASGNPKANKSGGSGEIAAKTATQTASKTSTAAPQRALKGLRRGGGSRNRGGGAAAPGRQEREIGDRSKASLPPQHPTSKPQVQTIGSATGQRA